jgi:hypothetical protein
VSETGKEEAINPVASLIEGLATMNIASRGGIVKRGLSGAKKFALANPLFVAGAAALAIDRYNKHKLNKRKSVNLYSSNPDEHKIMKNVVDALVQTGKFRLEKSEYAGKDKHWLLKKVRT